VIAAARFATFGRKIKHCIALRELPVVERCLSDLDADVRVIVVSLCDKYRRETTKGG